MIFLAPALVIVSIGFFCWLLFTLAIFALPFFVSLTLGSFALHSGAGVPGAILIGLMTGVATFLFGQLALAFAPWAWLRWLIILIYAAPAAVAGYNATHGITQLAMPSPTWQTVFSVIGAIAVGMTAIFRLTGVATPGLTGQRMAPT